MSFAVRHPDILDLGRVSQEHARLVGLPVKLVAIVDPTAAPQVKLEKKEK